MDDAAQLARFDALFPTDDRLPVLAWRAALLACAQSAAPAALWPRLEERVRTDKYTPLAARCAQHVAEAAQTYAPWADAVPLAQSVRWCSAWLGHAQARPASEVRSSDAAQLSDLVVAIASAAAARDARQRGAYAERLAARLVLLARAPPAACADAAPFLVRLAEALHAPAAAWDASALALGETCAACGASIPFTLAQYAQCTAGHVFGTCAAYAERCVATLSLLHATDTLTCVGCGRKALRTALAEVRGPFPNATACSACGNRYRSP